MDPLVLAVFLCSSLQVFATTLNCRGISILKSARGDILGKEHLPLDFTVTFLLFHLFQQCHVSSFFSVPALRGNLFFKLILLFYISLYIIFVTCSP